MRALVTGATGFIGRHLTRALLDRGDDVTCLVRASSDRSGLEGARFAVGDVLAPESLAAPVQGVDAVFHLASLLKAPWMPAFRTVNAEGTGRVAAACARAQTPPALIAVSTLAAGGPAPSLDAPRTEALPPAPVSLYGRVKLDAERAASALADRVPVSVARPPMVMGPGDRTVLRMFRGAARGLHLSPSPAPVALIDVRDLVTGLIAVAERGERAVPGVAGSGIYYLARESPVPYPELGRAVGRAVGREVRVLPAPRPILWCAAALGELGGRIRDRPSFMNLDKYREMTAGPWVCDVSKAQRDLGFVSGETLETRLAETAGWYREAGWL